MHTLWEGEHTPSYIIVGGKGGVGKTTTSCALAMRLAQEGKKTLLISTDPAHNAGDVLGVKLTGKMSQILGSPNNNLYAMEVAPGEFLQQVLGVKGMEGLDSINSDSDSGSGSADGKASTSPSKLSDPAIESPLPLDFNQLPGHMQAIAKEAREWVHAFPGMDESLGLFKLLESPEIAQFNVVVFDTAPTGHTLRLLSIPTILENVIARMQSWKVRLANYLSLIGNFFSSSKGPNLADLSKKLKEANAICEKLKIAFSDPMKTKFVPVMIPEALSVMETERMIAQLRHHRINSDIIIVNQLLDPLFIDSVESEEENGKLAGKKKKRAREASNASGDDMRDSALELCAARAKMQQHYLAEIHKLFGGQHNIVAVPALAKEPKGRDGLLSFSNLWHDTPRNLRHPRYGSKSLSNSNSDSLSHMSAKEVLDPVAVVLSTTDGPGNKNEHEPDAKRSKKQ